jgi:hypothetical protein
VSLSIVPSVHFQALIDSRREDFAFAELGMASTKIDGVYTLNFGILTFFDQQPPDRNVVFDYGTLLLERRRMSAGDAFRVLDRSKEEGSTPEGFSTRIPKSQFELAPWAWNEFRGLPNPIGSPRFVPWPARSFILAPSDRATTPVAQGPIVNTRLPVISDPRATIENFLGGRFLQYPGSAGIAVFMPDYSARFRRVLVSDDSISAEFEAGNRPKEQLMVRVAVDNSEVVQGLVLDWEAGSATVSGPTVQASFEMFLLDRERDRLVDWVQLRAGATEYPSEVVFSSPASQMTRLVRTGENEAQEFKQEIGDGDRLTQSVVAFANTRGGTIFVGVDDLGKPHASDLKGAAESIEKMIRSRCDPYIQVGFEEVVFEEVPILLVKVPEGQEKPYVHSKRGAVLLRGGRNNFAATSHEIRGLLAPKRP